MKNCPPNTYYGPLCSIAIIQDRPRYHVKEEAALPPTKGLVQKFLILQSDETNNMHELFDHAGVGFCLFVVFFGLHCTALVPTAAARLAATS